jgi:hypothetical protein
VYRSFWVQNLLVQFKIVDFVEKADCIQSESINAFFQPEFEHILKILKNVIKHTQEPFITYLHFFVNSRVSVIEIWLFGRVLVQVELLAITVPGPHGTAKVTGLK